MNRQQLFTAGSVLLATTALSSAANAGSVSATVAAGDVVTAKAYTATNIANTVFSTTAATANAVTVGSTQIYVVFANNFTAATKFSVELSPVNAGLIQAVDATILLTATGSFAVANWTVAATTACTSVTPLTTKIILDGCGGTGNKIVATNGLNANTSSGYGGVLFSGVSFNNASGLASAGAAIGVTGLVYNANNTSQTFENISAANVVLSATPVQALVSSGGTATANASATPVAFAYFTTSTSTLGGVSSQILAFVELSSNGTFAADLTTQVRSSGAAGASQGVSSLSVTVTSTELSQASILAIWTNTNTALYNGTVANFSAGVATFSIQPATGFTSFYIAVSFSGTAALSAASAGTVSLAFGTGNSMQQVVPAVTGKTGTISLGGFNAELNTFLSSSNTAFSSFARIHNNGIIASTATVTVRNDVSGASMGVFTTASIATNSTLQISAKDIEAGAGITAAAGVNYTLSISGAFSGYAQHIIFNPATGQLADLSSFRNRGGASVTTP